MNFNNPLALIRSLDERPQKSWLRKIHECIDEKALKYFLRDKNLENINLNNNNLNLLWECCQIPDFVKKTYGNHYDVIANVFKYLNSKKAKISDNYMRLQLMKLDKLDGVYENTKVLPKAWIVGEIKSVKSQKESLMETLFTLSSEVYSPYG